LREEDGVDKGLQKGGSLEKEKHLTFCGLVPVSLREAEGSKLD